MVNLVAVCSSILTLCLIGSALTAPATRQSSYAVKDSHSVPRKWSNIGPAPIDHILNLQIALRQSRFDELEKHLHEISNPFHERYGQHLTFDEVNDLVKPNDDTLELVHSWLQEHGVKLDDLDYTPAKDWITVPLPVSAVEDLLDTKYSVYKHEDGGHIVRAPVWSLPLHLHEHIETIQPTNSFFRPEPQKKAMKPVGKGDLPDFFEFQPTKQHKPGQGVAEVCNVDNVTPLCLRTLYGTINYTPQVPGKNVVGLANYLKESNNRSDTEIFLKRYRPEAASAAYEFKVHVIAGGDDQQTPDTPDQLADGKDLEGNLDVETILAIDYPTPLIAFTTGGSPPFIPDKNTPTNTNEPYIVWLQYVLAQTSLPQAISTSYADDEQTVPYAYAKRACEGFAQLGARGISLFFASGDGGVGPTGECITNDGKNTTQFIPLFPPSCPYVTVVGATKNFNPEVVAYDPLNGFSSGGGFSNYFERPVWQDKAVSGYLERLNSSYAYPGLYNKKGRGYPDIAAQGQSYAVVWFGRNIHLDGTSASTPCATSVISLVNDALIAENKPPLGWLNPWLYAVGHKAFNDITIGSTLGCDTDGFPAKPGWDAATGFGTPNFPALKELVLGQNGCKDTYNCALISSN